MSGFDKVGKGGEFDHWAGKSAFQNPRVDWIDFDLTEDPTMIEGRLAHNVDEGTLSYGMIGGTVNMSIGTEMFLPYQAYNNSGTALENGKVVYIESANLNRFNLKLASATVYLQANATIAVSTEHIADKTHGWFTTFGVVRDLATDAFGEGDILYLSDTAGELTNVKPSTNPIIVGKCLVSHPNFGRILVDIDNIIPKWGDVIGGNYTEVEADGTLKCNGTAKTWVDIDFPIVIRTTGVGIPTQATLQGNLTMPQWGVNDFNVCEIQEIPHIYAEGTNGSIHIHIITGGTDITNRYLNFEVEYTWANFDTTLPANIVATSGDFLIPANTPALTHFIIHMATFTGTNAKIGGHIKARLKRIASVGTAPTANPFCEMMQMHIEVDTMGSRNLTTK